MYPIKQSTAITVPFFVHDVNGDAVTGLTDGSFTKRISKNGGAFAAMTVTITEMENGWYSIPLSAAHSDTLGLLSIAFTNAGAKQVNLQFRVHARLPDDLAFPTTSGRSLDITTTGEAGIDLDNVNGTLDAADIGANAITAAKIAASALDGKGDWNTTTPPTADSIADAVWDELQSAHVTAGSFGEIATEIATILARVPDTVSLANINAEVDTALNTAIPGSPTANSINERIKALDDVYTAARGANLDNLDAAITTRSSHNAAAVLAAGDIDGYTLEEILKLVGAVLVGKVSGAETSSNVFRAADDSKARVTATVDANGNRTALVLDATG